MLTGRNKNTVASTGLMDVDPRIKDMYNPEDFPLETGIVGNVGGALGRGAARAVENVQRRADKVREIQGADMGELEKAGHQLVNLGGVVVNDLVFDGLVGTALDAVVPGTGVGDALESTVESGMKYIGTTKVAQDLLKEYDNLPQEDKVRLGTAGELFSFLGAGQILKVPNTVFRNVRTRIPGFYYPDPKKFVSDVSLELGRGGYNALKEFFTAEGDYLIKNGIPPGLVSELKTALNVLDNGEKAIKKNAAGEVLSKAEQKAFDYMRYVHGDRMDMSSVSKAKVDLEGAMVAKMYMLEQMGMPSEVLRNLTSHLFTDYRGKFTDLPEIKNQLRYVNDNSVSDTALDGLLSYVNRGLVGGTGRRADNTHVFIRKPSGTAQLATDVMGGENNPLRGILGQVDLRGLSPYETKVTLERGMLSPAGIDKYMKGIRAAKTQAEKEAFVKSLDEKYFPGLGERAPGVDFKMNVNQALRNNPRTQGMFEKIDNWMQSDGMKDYKFKAPTNAQMRRKNTVRQKPDGTFEIIYGGTKISNATELGGIGTYYNLDPKTGNMVGFILDGHDMWGMDPLGGQALITISQPVSSNYYKDITKRVTKSKKEGKPDRVSYSMDRYIPDPQTGERTKVTRGKYTNYIDPSQLVQPVDMGVTERAARQAKGVARGGMLLGTGNWAADERD